MELTKIVCAGAEWWSLAFGAFGKPPRMREHLHAAVLHMLGAHPRHPPLTIVDSHSYPAGLNERV